ncbi:hypothetical protein NNJEOMEG_02723 [Fundidesulfovibrio magnetotacticus]|uniref:Nucleoside transporter/FeoB GTPase Gate domain-containing protein n=1 Tax=Fundidesulfovibrio magnetotacticus TaxID=2730080 RepID=A0A6V8M349_9BACT|nr:hypothetical protein [Fundidesulfovibrio magnetotacticus]GFK94875.1 hypothetical protein NNJEOMEG_02723 [Fundidesulfovibrio magnetotacticus]
MTLEQFAAQHAWPLAKLLAGLCVSLLLANLLETLNWTRSLARFARPLVRAGHMRDVTGASFTLAFFSGMAANTMLAEAHRDGTLSDRELILSNLFNSLPTYFLHLPTMLLVAGPFIGPAAFVYVGLTLGAAVLRSAGIVAAGRALLPRPPEDCLECRLPERGPTWREALAKSWRRFKRRIVKICLITAPIYAAMAWLNQAGFFAAAERFVGERLAFLDWLSPKAASIVVFGMAAEFTAGLAAAGALLNAGELPVKEVVLALLAGNILSTPVRAFRHQFPYYAGIFRPALAMRLIVHNQAFRAASLVAVGVVYWLAA